MLLIGPVFDFWSVFLYLICFSLHCLYLFIYFYSDDFYAAQMVFDGVCGVLNSLYFDFGLLVLCLGFFLGIEPHRALNWACVWFGLLCVFVCVILA